MIILVALISRAFYSPEVGPEVQNRGGFVCCSFGGPGNGVTNAHPEIGSEGRNAENCCTLTVQCPNQVGPGNESEPQNGDRVKQKTGLIKKRTVPFGGPGSCSLVFALATFPGVALS